MKEVSTGITSAASAFSFLDRMRVRQIIEPNSIARAARRCLTATPSDMRAAKRLHRPPTPPLAKKEKKKDIQDTFGREFIDRSRRQAPPSTGRFSPTTATSDQAPSDGRASEIARCDPKRMTKFGGIRLLPLSHSSAGFKAHTRVLATSVPHACIILAEFTSTEDTPAARASPTPPSDFLHPPRLRRISL
jgi:hypothetical protein